MQKSDARPHATQNLQPADVGSRTSARMSAASDTLAHRRVGALGMAATADNISSLCLAFAVRAAIIAVLLGETVATWVGALLLGFHARPVCTLSSELLHGVLGVLNSRSSRRNRDRPRSRESSCPIGHNSQWDCSMLRRSSRIRSYNRDNNSRRSIRHSLHRNICHHGNSPRDRFGSSCACYCLPQNAARC
jgi:hypothetical protein